MAFERAWPVVSPQPFTANGTQFGLVTVADTAGFKVKQSAYLQATSLPNLAVQVKVVLSRTQLIVGLVDNKIAQWPNLNVSAYTVALGASIGAEKWPKNKIGLEDIFAAVYDADPTVALRNVLVDQYGDYWGTANPLPVSVIGSFPVTTRRLTDKDNDPLPGDVHDAVRVGNGSYDLLINPDGSINVNQQNSVTLNPSIANVSMPLAATEYSFAFPANTLRFTMKIRNGTSKAQFAYVSGDSGTLFFTLQGGYIYGEESNMTGKTIYFQATKASQIMEILYWTV